MKRNNREYRNVEMFEVRAEEQNPEKRWVEGYASTFEPYVLFEEDGIQYLEVIDRHAFDDADFSDCCFLKDHEGAVLARTKNKTVLTSTDDHGLKIRADLTKTEAARAMLDEIDAGMYDQMSFAFTVSEDAYDRDTHTRKILKVKKVYDVSAVGIPANPGTEIGVATRSAFDGFIEMERAERLKEEKRQKDLELRKRKLRLRAKTEV